MATVAICPRCSHDLLVPHDTNLDAWAQCSACDVLFQVRDAITRELGELRLVEPLPKLPVEEPAEATHATAQDERVSPHPTPTVDFSSQKTVDEVTALVRSESAESEDIALVETSIGEEADSPKTHDQSAPTVEDFSKSLAPTWEERAEEESGEASTDGLEAELASMAMEDDGLPSEMESDLAAARTVDDVPDLPDSLSADAGATVELHGEPVEAAETDFELESSSEPLVTDPVATWDDSEQMERLLAAAEPPADEDAPTPIPQIRTDADQFTTQHRDAPAEQPLINADMFAMPPGARRRRRRSPVRTLTGIVVFGIIGIGLGALALLWLKGTDGDVLNVAQYLPRAILPAEFSAASRPLAGTPSRRLDRDTEPAAFESPATPEKSTNESILDDVMAMQAEEPGKFEPAGAGPLVNDEAPHVTGAPTFTADQLAVSLKTAQEAQPGLVQGDLRDGREVQHAKGYSYSILCDLAHKATFVDAGSRADFAATLQSEADDLFRAALADAHTRNDVALILPRWMSYHKRQHGGVFFGGTIEGEVGKGSVVECRVDVGASEPVTILVPKTKAEALDHSGRPVAVIGSIVDSPAEKVSGYEGDATQAVWVGRIIPLE